MWHDFRGIHLVDKDGKHIGDINANQIVKHERAADTMEKYNQRLDKILEKHPEYLKKYGSREEIIKLMKELDGVE